MNEQNIFNNPIVMDVFCMDIIEDWMKYQKACNMPVSSEEFMYWIDDFVSALEYNFDDVYEEEFGHREDEEE